MWSSSWCFATVTMWSGVLGVPDGPLSLNYELVFLNDHPLAVCNDGSPAAYYVHHGSDPTRFVLHQQGGWWCWDEYSCRVRWDHFANHTTEKRTLMSSTPLAALTQLHDTFNGEKNTGIMTHNASVNPMANATKIFLAYCSSDAHAGNRSSGPLPRAGTSKWHFRGKDIVRAVIAELVVKHGLGGAVQFVLTGGSAGGMATLNNADYVSELIHAVAPAVRYVAMPDSGYFLDVAPGQMCQLPDRYECLCAAGADPAVATDGWTRAGGHSWLGTGQTLAQQVQAMTVFSQGIPDASCTAHYGAYGRWRCYLGQYSAPFLEAPTLLLQNQIDEWQGFWNGFFNYTTDPIAFEYAEWFRGVSQSTLREVAATPSIHVFSPNCYHHGLSYDDIFWSVRVDGWSSSTMLASLLRGHPTPQLVVDGCQGLPCSPETNGHPDCVPVDPPGSQ